MQQRGSRRRRPQSATARLSVDKRGTIARSMNPSAPHSPTNMRRGAPPAPPRHVQAAPQAHPHAYGAKRSSGGERGSDLHDTLEEYASTIRALKAERHTLMERANSQQTVVARLERELGKMTRHVNQLLESRSDANSSRISVHDIRKENEKSLLVRRLREQITSLQSQLSKKEVQLSTAKRHQNATSMMEMAAAKEEFYAEVQRLNVVMHETDAQHKREIEELHKQLHAMHAAASGQGPMVMQQHIQQVNAQAHAQSHGGAPVWFSGESMTTLSVTDGERKELSDLRAENKVLRGKLTALVSQKSRANEQAAHVPSTGADGAIGATSDVLMMQKHSADDLGAATSRSGERGGGRESAEAYLDCLGIEQQSKASSSKPQRTKRKKRSKDKSAASSPLAEASSRVRPSSAQPAGAASHRAREKNSRVRSSKHRSTSPPVPPSQRRERQNKVQPKGSSKMKLNAVDSMETLEREHVEAQRVEVQRVYEVAKASALASMQDQLLQAQMQSENLTADAMDTYEHAKSAALEYLVQNTQSVISEAEGPSNGGNYEGSAPLTGVEGIGNVLNFTPKGPEDEAPESVQGVGSTAQDILSGGGGGSSGVGSTPQGGNHLAHPMDAADGDRYEVWFKLRPETEDYESVFEQIKSIPLALARIGDSFEVVEEEEEDGNVSISIVFRAMVKDDSDLAASGDRGDFKTLKALSRASLTLARPLFSFPIIVEPHDHEQDAPPPQEDRPGGVPSHSDARDKRTPEEDNILHTPGGAKSPQRPPAAPPSPQEQAPQHPQQSCEPGTSPVDLKPREEDAVASPTTAATASPLSASDTKQSETMVFRELEEPTDGAASGGVDTASKAQEVLSELQTKKEVDIPMEYSPGSTQQSVSDQEHHHPMDTEVIGTHIPEQEPVPMPDLNAGGSSPVEEEKQSAEETGGTHILEPPPSPAKPLTTEIDGAQDGRGEDTPQVASSREQENETFPVSPQTFEPSPKPESEAPNNQAQEHEHEQPQPTSLPSAAASAAPTPPLKEQQRAQEEAMVKAVTGEEEEEEEQGGEQSEGEDSGYYDDEFQSESEDEKQH